MNEPVVWLGGLLGFMLGAAATSCSSGGGTRDAAGNLDAPADAIPDRPDGDALCTTSFGAENKVLFAFDGGASPGWSGSTGDPPNSNVSASIGASATDGHACPGSVTFTVARDVFSGPDGGVAVDQASLRYTFSAQPPASAGYDFTGYWKLHAWAKVTTASYAALESVYAYATFVDTNPNVPSPQTFTAGPTGSFTDDSWREMVVDLTVRSAVTARIDEIGFQVQANPIAPAGGPAVPPPIELRVDDIWLEALPPPPDGGFDDDAGPN